MSDSFLDKLLFILVLAIIGLLIQLLTLHKDYKVYVDLYIQVISFVVSSLALYQFFKSK